jgi:hypothetical protein
MQYAEISYSGFVHFRYQLNILYFNLFGMKCSLFRDVVSNMATNMR